MDFATILGIIAGAIVVLIAIMLGGEFGTFINVPSVLIVVGGGFSATIIRFPLANVLKALVLGGQVAFTQKKLDPKDMIDELVEMADVIRKDGPLGLEGRELAHECLEKGAQMVADGYEPAMIQEMMERERDLYLERLDEAKRIYKAIGEAAPAFGMIGTLVGLVQMLSTMEDPAAIGPAMAVALLTTLYGAVISNLIALPIADKLGGKSKIEEINSTLAIDGVMQLRANKSPTLVREMLMAYLPEKQRHLIEAEMATA